MRGCRLARDASPSTCAEHLGVHHLPPGEREQGQHDHARVAGGQHRRLREVAQRLVAPHRVRVVVAVPLQVVQQHVRRDVVAVPRVRRVDLLVPSAGHPDPPQAVVLQVVHALQQQDADDRLHHQERQQARAERDAEPAPQHHRHQPGVEDVVADRPDRAVLAGEAHPLQPPGVAQAADHAARPELVDDLAEPGAGRVLRRRDAGVVAAVVLDEEVAVERLRESDLREPLLVLLALVAELVRGVDADAGDAAERDREADPVDQRQPERGERPAAPDQRGVLHRQEQVGDPPVVAVLLEPGEGVLRRVLGVAADQQVDQRDQAEDEHRPEPPEPAPAGGLDQAPRGHAEQRDHHAEQPQVPLRVAPRGRRRGRVPTAVVASVIGPSLDIAAPGVVDLDICSSFVKRRRGREPRRGPGCVPWSRGGTVDDAEFDRFYAGSAARLVGQLHAMTGDRAEAQDCVQEAFVRAWAHRRRLDAVPEPGGLGAHHRVPDLRQQVAPRHLRAARPPPARAGAGPARRRPPRPASATPSCRRCGRSARGSARPSCCTTSATCSIDQIASETGVPVSTVKTRLFRGRQALAPLLAPATDSEGAHHV